MKALIFAEKVIQIEPIEFEVCPDMQWVEAEDFVTTGMIYADGVFSVPPVVEHIKTYTELRQAEYPPLGEFADAFVKLQSGDHTQMDQYVVDCLVVKAKYPK